MKAGLDLEMSGPPVWRTDALQRCVVAQKCEYPKSMPVYDRYKDVLKLINKVTASGIRENTEETGEPTEEMVSLLRQAAGSSNALLKNDTNPLPLSPSSMQSIATIGPNADAPVYSGGGSANLRPYNHTTALEGIRGALSESLKVQYVIGAHAHKETPLLGYKQLRTRDGKPGFDINWFHEYPVENPKAERVHYTHATSSACWLLDNLPDDLSMTCWATVSGTYTPEVVGKGLCLAELETVSIAADMYVNGTKIIDNSTKPAPGPTFFGTASREVIGTITLEANKPAQILIQFANSLIAQSRGFSRPALNTIPLIWGASHFGGRRAFSEDEGIQEAVDAAKQVDTAVLVIGLNNGIRGPIFPSQGLQTV